MKLLWVPNDQQNEGTWIRAHWYPLLALVTTCGAALNGGVEWARGWEEEGEKRGSSRVAENLSTSVL